MWMMTTFGFFSIVEKPSDRAAGTLTVRARARADLDHLRAEILPGLGPTVDHAGTDYPYRAVAPRGEVAVALANLAMKLDYANFKDAVAARQGKPRAQAYGQVWSVLHDIEDLPPAAPATPPLRPAKTPASAGGRKKAYGGVLVDGEGRVLLRKPTGGYDGYAWTFPKGRPDAGESPEACALRETREETGYCARILAPIPGAFAGGTTDNRYFLMAVAGEQGPLDAETAATRWATPAEARHLIGETTNTVGRARDLAVLDAAIAALVARR
jgi:8-oxo-dGTP pyrophosphatase MutT (NUDIX family)